MDRVPGGDLQEFQINGLSARPSTTVGIRAIDDCSNRGPVRFFTFNTADHMSGEVPWCFVATAAYGSTMANDVDMLRQFRDALLTRTVLGELAVEAYYTFAPAVSGVVGESEVLRAIGARHPRSDRPLNPDLQVLASSSSTVSPASARASAIVS